ncbi:MAG: biotin--[acetyl-CoA-carboxylase] ligase [Spirochaetales bacterium]|nr:biotin--[acetyl-CoA-carboxylase] ligase [Spirochaetales bacterium]
MVNDIHKLIYDILASSESPVSGTCIGKQVGVSKVAVWKHIQTLRRNGYAISTSAKGYTLAGKPDTPDNLQIERKNTTVYHYDTIASTMNAVLQKDLTGEFTFISADAQTEGRGYDGTAWESPDGGLYGTLAFSSSYPIFCCDIYQYLSATAIIRVLYELYGVSVSFMWPSDFILDNKKIGGLLMEVHGGYYSSGKCMLGTGLYVHNKPSKTGAACLDQFVSKPTSRADIVNSYLTIFLDFLNKMPVPRIVEFFNKHRHLLKDAVLTSEKIPEGAPGVFMDKIYMRHPSIQALTIHNGDI